MKAARKLLFVVLLMFFALALTACGDKGESEKEEETKSEAAPGQDDKKPEATPTEAPDYPTIDWSEIPEASEEDFKAEKAGGGVVITEYYGEGGNVKIPAQIRGYDVVYINEAFQDCETITGVYIPDTVTEIRSYAFQNSKELTYVRLPETLRAMGAQAFEGTAWLEARMAYDPLVIENGIVIEGRNCSGDVTIPEGVYMIGASAFYGCEGLTSVALPDSLERIEIWAFANCGNLVDITVPDGTAKVAAQIFNGSEKVSVKYKGTTYSYEELDAWYEAHREANPI